MAINYLLTPDLFSWLLKDEVKPYEDPLSNASARIFDVSGKFFWPTSACGTNSWKYFALTKLI